MLKLAPSILSADFNILGQQISDIEKGGTRYLHVDVMDGHFVPNISLGLPIIESIRKKTNLIFDVHLMIENPEKYVEAFANAGADIISFHIEATEKPLELVRKIKELGKIPAIAVKMETPISSLFEIAKEVDMILLMSIAPGFGGQKLIEKALDRAVELRKFLNESNLDVDIEMDGGINLDNINQVIESGVNVIVVGSALFSNDSITDSVKNFLNKFKEYGDIY